MRLFQDWKIIQDVVYEVIKGLGLEKELTGAKDYRFDDLDQVDRMRLMGN